MQEGWCDSKGTLEDVKSKLQMRQEGAFKRERALAYSLAQKVTNCEKVSDLLYSCLRKMFLNLDFFQQWRSTPISNSRANATLSSLKNYGVDKANWGWSWLERWMAAKPWESRLMEQNHADSSDKTPPPPPKKCVGSTNSKTSEPCLVKVRKNNVSTRISARPPHTAQATRSSSSPSSEFQYDESSASSSIWTSTTPTSGNVVLACDRTEDSSSDTRPSYMNLTESTKAKRKTSNHLHNRAQREQSMDEFQFLKRASVLSNGDSKSNAGSDASINYSRPLYLPTYMDKSSVKPR